MVKKRQLKVVISVVKRGSFGWLLVWLKRGTFVVTSVVKKGQFWVVFRVVKKR